MCHKVQRSLTEDETKSKDDDSPVTIADYAAQATVALTLGKDGAPIRLVAEEDADDLRAGGKTTDAVLALVRDATGNGALSADDVCDAIDVGLCEGGNAEDFWVLDPIDGTRGFVGRRQYAVCLGHVEAASGDVTLGLLGCPNLPFTGGDVSKLADGSGGVASVLDSADPDALPGSLFFAAKGRGAFVGPLDGSGPFVRIGKTADVDADAPPAFMESYEARHSDHSFSGKVARAVFEGTEPKPALRADSQCKYGLLALGGIADIYMRFPPKDYREKIWDHAAGICIVQEAGGVISDAKGRRLRVNEGRFLPEDLGGGICAASTAAWHERLVAAIAKVVKENAHVAA